MRDGGRVTSTRWIQGHLSLHRNDWGMMPIALVLSSPLRAAGIPFGR